jgi:hypothetical protein
MDLSGVGGSATPAIKDEFKATSTAVPTYGTGGELVEVTNSFAVPHLEGETVDVLGDLGVQDQKVVTSGVVTTSRRHQKCLIGLPYTPDMIDLPVNAGNPRGTAQGRKKRVDHVGIRRMNSIGGTVTAYGDGVEQNENPIQEVRAPMNSSPDLQSNYKEATIEMAYNEDGQIRIRQTQPYPLTVLNIIKELRVWE